jgi:dicarboxylate/amino acid:cation (Na+ or H+) symporter, DAACS family
MKSAVAARRRHGSDAGFGAPRGAPPPDEAAHCLRLRLRLKSNMVRHATSRNQGAKKRRDGGRGRRFGPGAETAGRAQSDDGPCDTVALMTDRKAEGVESGKILGGLILGSLAGAAANWAWSPDKGEAPSAAYERATWIADNVAKPIGDIFLSMLFMVVVPVVFCSLVLGVAGIGQMKSLGRIGAKAFGWFIGTTILAGALGLVVVNVVRPGDAIDAAQAAEIREVFKSESEAKTAQGKSGTGFSIDTIVNIVPRNVFRAASNDSQILGVIFFAICIGVAATGIPRDRSKVFIDFLQTFYDLCVRVLWFAMKLAPYGVAGLTYAVTVYLGADVLKALGMYVAIALFGLAFHLFITLGSLVALMLKMNPIRFFKRVRGLMATAFSTSSSSATMPATMRTAIDEFGAPQSTTGFVIPLGATVNMDGTALFEGVSVLFLAQVAGVELSIVAQIGVLALAVLTAIGAAGVPGGSLPLLAIVLQKFDIPAESLGLIIGVDRLVDMSRTVPNVVSDLIGSLWVAKSEGAELIE